MSRATFAFSAAPFPKTDVSDYRWSDRERREEGKQEKLISCGTIEDAMFSRRLDVERRLSVVTILGCGVFTSAEHLMLSRYGAHSCRAGSWKPLKSHTSTLSERSCIAVHKSTKIMANAGRVTQLAWAQVDQRTRRAREEHPY